MRKAISNKKVNYYFLERGFVQEIDFFLQRHACRKALKMLNSIEYVSYVFNSLSPSQQISYIEKFFPNKLYELQTIGEFQTVKFAYYPIDEKIHWTVEQNGKARHFKLKTTEFLSRSEEEIKLAQQVMKSSFDKINGYWYTDEGYITDGCKNNGKYRKIEDV